MTEAARREAEDRQMAGHYEPALRTTNARAAGIDDLRQVMSDTQVLDLVKADWERRMRTRRGRVLLWMLRKWT